MAVCSAQGLNTIVHRKEKMCTVDTEKYRVPSSSCLFLGEDAGGGRGDMCTDDKSLGTLLILLSYISSYDKY
jgi:hypothetical protein